ncbi:M81 family metallopeptidase [Ferrovibrio terrae]|uniref:Microcystinase C n=1 Tax=Ferrovibrio terrae TaxID=2594003 RepID=A0A516H539_9PROT|nr:M81 family metallopeptidase [Ferrovibrio terrae]QDO98855.1 M81 family metallopeptidase [Ferrovibrio terrae]
MTYRVAIAGFQHETNTFAPTRATLDLFIKGEGWPPLTEGRDIVEVFSPMNIPIGGFMNAAKPKGWELHPIVWAAAAPSSYVSTEAFEYIAGKILNGIAALKGRIDAVYLDLHGAMVTEAHEDGEGELLRRVRALVGPDMPIGVSLDLHANVTPEMLQYSDVMIGYRTYPHLDMAVTGARVLRHMEKLLTGERKKQAKALRQIPFLIPLTAQCTFIEPCKSLYDTLGDMEHGAVSSLSFSPGFHPADIHHCGPSVIAYGDTQAAADKAADDFARQIIEREAEFKLNLLSPHAAIDQARKLIQAGARKSIVLADVQDNPGTGATSDTTGLLAALVAEHVPDATLGLLYDPEVAKIAHQAGEGSEIEVSVGGKLLDVEGARPYRNRFRVAKLGSGKFLCTGPFYKGTRMDLGLMARLQVNGVDLVIASARVQAADKDQYRHLGIEPGERQIVGVKSTVHFRGDFTDIAHDILNVESPGAFIERAETLPYKKLRKGMKLAPKGRAF